MIEINWNAQNVKKHDFRKIWVIRFSKWTLHMNNTHFYIASHSTALWHWVHDCCAIYPCAVFLQCVPDMQSPAPHACTHLPSLLPAAVECSGLISCSIYCTIMHATLSSLQAIGSMAIFASDLMSVFSEGWRAVFLLAQSGFYKLDHIPGVSWDLSMQVMSGKSKHYTSCMSICSSKKKCIWQCNPAGQM